MPKYSGANSSKCVLAWWKIL